MSGRIGYGGVERTQAVEVDAMAGLAAFMVDEQRYIVDANPMADALLDDGTVLALSFRRLVAARQCDGAKLDHSFDQARDAGISRTGLGEGWLQMEIVRMGGGEPKPRFLALVRSTKYQWSRKISDAALRYGLTGAEKRLLAILFEGSPLFEAAHRLGIARTTARSHLQKLFDKTGTRRQADLLRMVALSGSV